MQKTINNILIVATVIAMLPLQSFALNEQTISTNTSTPDSSKNITNTGMKRF